MASIPFPAWLAAESSRTGRRLQSSDYDDAGRRRSRSSLPEAYTAKGVAAFRWSDGRVGLANNMYAPQHPEGTEPGLADVRYTVEHYPNDTSGYVPNILKFTSITELEAETGHTIDRTAAALLMKVGEAHVVVARSEEDLVELVGNLDPAVKILRAPITHVDASIAMPMRNLVAIYSTGGGLNFYASTFDNELQRALQERYNFLPKAETVEDFVENIEQHGSRHGWIVSDIVNMEDTPRAIPDHMKLDDPEPGF